MSRARLSVAANIAEGCGRGGKAEMTHFLRTPIGSASELDYHCLLARDFGFFRKEECCRPNANVTEVRRMHTFLEKKALSSSYQRANTVNS